MKLSSFRIICYPKERDMEYTGEWERGETEWEKEKEIRSLRVTEGDDFSVEFVLCGSHNHWRADQHQQENIMILLLVFAYIYILMMLSYLGYPMNNEEIYTFRSMLIYYLFLFFWFQHCFCAFYSVDELRKLLNDKEAYNALFNSLDQVKIQNNVSTRKWLYVFLIPFYYFIFYMSSLPVNA